VTLRLGPRARRAAKGFTFLGVAVCLAACASIWGFQDLKDGDAAVDADAKRIDAEPSVADGSETSDATQPADSATGDDEVSLVEDVKSSKDASPMRDAAHDGPSASPDGSGVNDATAFMKCVTICSGCCDPSGRCVAMAQQSQSVCGTGGNACADCTADKTCPLTEAPCCGSNGCGCAVAGVIGCN
jgi:hypothetical protein